jgi:pimeloyl-ACP methyl ester carboxylesterase
MQEMGTWILLRGLMRDARHWGSFPSHFQQKFPQDKILALDFPGNGAFVDQASCINVEAMMQHCRSQLALRGEQPPYRLVALSLGAMVAIEWARQWPQEVECMALMNTSVAPINPFYERLRPRNYLALFVALSLQAIAQREKTLLRITTSMLDDIALNLVWENWTSLAQQRVTTRVNICRQLLAAMRFRMHQASPSVSTLMLVGDKDRLVNPNCSHTLAQRWNSSLVMHPHAGHDLVLDDEAWVIQQIETWSKSVQSQKNRS